MERDEAFCFLRESRQKLAEANLELRKLTAVDALTGLANRRCLDDVLRTEWLRARRDKYPVSLLLCNLDLFRLYGEAHGEEVADACLKKVAGIFTKNLKRPADMAARYGDEFAVLLPNTDSQGAMVVADACRLGVESLRIHSAGLEKKVVTVSIGVASIIPKEDLPYEELINVAARALQNATDQGRNMVRIARYRSVSLDEA